MQHTLSLIQGEWSVSLAPQGRGVHNLVTPPQAKHQPDTFGIYKQQRALKDTFNDKQYHAVLMKL